MMRIDQLKNDLRREPRQWCVTGCAGFIGSNLLETLLALDQRVVGLDNFSTGYRHNLEEVRQLVKAEQWQRFTFIEGDICDANTCAQACHGVDYVLHQAALGSVPRSISDPLANNQSNVTGFLNMIHAAQQAGVKSFTYASSSAVYGDHVDLPKVEDVIGRPLSPYAVSKYIDELYADIFATCYEFRAIGLRYFNVFGQRQDPCGAYAAVIPHWAFAMLNNEAVYINGDGETSRDFCFIDNVVQANLLAALAGSEAKNQVYNIALGDRTTLNELFAAMQTSMAGQGTHYSLDPVYRDFRAGDIRHSQADISKAQRLLGFAPVCRVAQGIEKTVTWYLGHQGH